jgi:hypothetical protein
MFWTPSEKIFYIRPCPPALKKLRGGRLSITYIATPLPSTTGTTRLMLDIMITYNSRITAVDIR